MMQLGGCLFMYEYNQMHQNNQPEMMNSYYFNPSFPYNNPYGPYYMNELNTFEEPINYSPYYYPIDNETEYGMNVEKEWQYRHRKQTSPFVQYFQGENGKIDIDKVFGTVNQAIRTAQQVSPIVRSVNNFVKNLK